MPIMLRPAGRGSFRATVLVLALSLPMLAGCGFNTIPTHEENARAAWNEVLNQSQKRADLIPILIETVKRFAARERDALERVLEARTRAAQVPVTPEILTDPEAFGSFRESQASLSGAVSRLFSAIEDYPGLGSNHDFLALQAQFERCDDHIAMARRDYIRAVRDYNSALTSLPSLIWAKVWFTENRPFQNFAVEKDDTRRPLVDSELRR